MYDKNIDAKWQKVWEEKKAFHAVTGGDKEKFYALIEFPYPSGAGLHVGHIRAFMGMEVLSRKKRMEGKNVLFPIGFDAFGLPTENYAMKNNIHPRIVTDKNIAIFTKQLKSVGYSFDWDRVIDTTDPNYYKWTQWIFLKLFEHGLAYKDKTYVNYCPKCRVILANEESQGGVCDRCDSEIVQMEKEVWMLKITDYADKLLDGLNEVNFPPRVRLEQENWIGRSYGAEIDFKVDGKDEKLTVYTTRPDTIYGVTYMALAPEHPILDKYKDEIKNFDEILEYRKAAAKKTEFERVELAKDKTGVKVEGLEIVNPVTGKVVPLWVTDYVMMGYGTGAIMAVPAHDTRDYEFAKKFGMDIIQVVANKSGEEVDLSNQAYTDIEEGILINSEVINGLSVTEAKEKITKYLEDNNIGKAKKNYHMKDWAFARQRYWGEPVPIIKCPHCGLVPLKEEDLPLELPDVKDFIPGEDGESPLARVESWVNVKCPKCGGDAKRETDTMPQWAGSSWYFLRYMDPHNNDALASKEALDYWKQVDCYNGGMEHVTRHLIYSRFWHRFLYDIGVVPTAEPYARRSTQGLILAHDGSKMSKSKGNVVNPDDIVKEYGADTLRTYILFIGDYGMEAPWSETGVKGAKKFLDRVMRIESLVTDEDITSKELDREINVTIKKVSEDYEDMKYNTAIAAMMSYVNVLYKQEKVSKKYVRPLIQLLNPIAPHVTEELWEKLGFEGYLFESKWPEYDESKLVADEIEIPVQVNGTVRYKITVPADSDEATIEQVAKENPALSNYMAGKEIKKVIVIKSKIVNIVIG
ncbi:MAG: leucine--tRNA ligase [Clostridia bacterium]|jgi:leucyl-tRNA synthetase|nr:leucine--tRNA ligase [Clostridia bacterium]